MNELITDIKRARVEIDANIKHLHEIAAKIARGTGGREISLAITQLQQGKSWAGQALEELGYQLPEEYRDEAIF